MTVKGNTSGNTFVSVENVGGLDSKTLNGIELIQISGISEGEFVQKGRIVAGAYDYSLQRGTGENAANWYLSNQGDGSVEPEKPGEHETPVVPGKPTSPTTPGSSGGETQRPESASYTANLAAASTMFLTPLHDRLGET